MEGGTRTQFIKLLLLGACILKVAAKQFYFVSFDGSVVSLNNLKIIYLNYTVLNKFIKKNTSIKVAS